VYARVTLFELDTIRQGLDAGVERFRETILPALREQPGYAGVHVLANPDGKGLVVSLWDTPAEAEAALGSGFYDEQVDRFVAVFRAPPGREGYDVLLSDAPMLVPD
jgi:heme-degrading monooxygenase HmoA